MAFKCTWNWILQKNIRILTKFDKIWQNLTRFDQIWQNFAEKIKILTKFDQIFTQFDQIFDRIWIFWCIIKQFHPPPWRFSGPETGFCKKKSKFWLKKSLFLPYKMVIFYITHSNLSSVPLVYHKFHLNYISNFIWMLVRVNKWLNYFVTGASVLASSASRPLPSWLEACPGSGEVPKGIWTLGGPHCWARGWSRCCSSG